VTLISNSVLRLGWFRKKTVVNKFNILSEKKVLVVGPRSVLPYTNH